MGLRQEPSKLNNNLSITLLNAQVHIRVINGPSGPQQPEQEQELGNMHQGLPPHFHLEPTSLNSMLLFW